MAKAVRFYETGGPEVLRYEEVEVGDPGPGQVRLRHVAVGLNYADTYFRNGTYPIPLPNGMGVEASGVVQAVGEGVTNGVGDRVTYTGFLNTLGAYSTERLIGRTADQASGNHQFRDRGGHDHARPDVGVPDAAHLRFQGRRQHLLHAAAGGVGLIVSQWAKLLGLTVIGTVSTEAKAKSPAPMAATMSSTTAMKTSPSGCAS
jgi:NADPH:quinone reductase-like Zn-dependent oxidoreductase